MTKHVHLDCARDDLLVAWHDGEAAALLDAAHARALGIHVAGCPACGARLAALDALEARLRTLNLADRPADAGFTRRVRLALPAPAAAPAWRRGAADLAAWGQRQAAALGLVLLGLTIMLATGDALGLLGAWWQEAGDWFSTASTSDASGVGTLLTTLPGGNTTPEAYLGLVMGAVLLALGTGVFVIRALAAQQPAAPARVPARQARLV